MTASKFNNWLSAWPTPPAAPLLMAVLNVTPDSFSDGGNPIDPARAAERAASHLADGADLIDIGAESTRPGADPTPEAEQLRRLLPVLKRLRDLPITLSIDTTRAAVAAAALDAGVTVVNDISAGQDDPAMFPLVARSKVPIILMHMQGTPKTMQLTPQYSDVTAEVGQFLRDRLTAATAAGIAPDRVLFDPGIGFGKTDDHNLTLLRDTAALATLGRPLVIGASRKGFIGRITAEPDASQRLFGTAAAVAWSAANGAAILRVHDVKAMRQVMAMTNAIQSAASSAKKS